MWFYNSETTIASIFEFNAIPFAIDFFFQKKINLRFRWFESFRGISATERQAGTMVESWTEGCSECELIHEQTYDLFVYLLINTDMANCESFVLTRVWNPRSFEIALHFYSRVCVHSIVIEILINFNLCCCFFHLFCDACSLSKKTQTHTTMCCFVLIFCNSINFVGMQNCDMQVNVCSNKQSTFFAFAIDTLRKQMWRIWKEKLPDSFFEGSFYSDNSGQSQIFIKLMCHLNL